MVLLGTARGRAEKSGRASQDFDADITETEAGMSKDEAEDLLGNAQARVTVSAERAAKYMGAGSSIFCSVSLSCNQDLRSIREARELALALSQEYLPEMLEMAEEVWQQDEEDSNPETRSKAKRGRSR